MRTSAILFAALGVTAIACSVAVEPGDERTGNAEQSADAYLDACTALCGAIPKAASNDFVHYPAAVTEILGCTSWDVAQKSKVFAGCNDASAAGIGLPGTRADAVAEATANIAANDPTSIDLAATRCAKYLPKAFSGKNGDGSAIGDATTKIVIGIGRQDPSGWPGRYVPDANQSMKQDAAANPKVGYLMQTPGANACAIMEAMSCLGNKEVMKKAMATAFAAKPYEVRTYAPFEAMQDNTMRDVLCALAFGNIPVRYDPGVLATNDGVPCELTATNAVFLQLPSGKVIAVTNALGPAISTAATAPFHRRNEFPGLGIGRGKPRVIVRTATASYEIHLKQADASGWPVGDGKSQKTPFVVSAAAKMPYGSVTVGAGTIEPGAVEELRCGGDVADSKATGSACAKCHAPGKLVMGAANDAKDGKTGTLLSAYDKDTVDRKFLLWLIAAKDSKGGAKPPLQETELTKWFEDVLPYAKKYPTPAGGDAFFTPGDPDKWKE